MVRMFVRHPVADFDTWKSHYDGFEATRQELGVRDAAVFRGKTDPNDVTAWHDFEDLDTAKAFASAPELAEAMQAAGVTSEPQIWFVDRDLPA